MSFICKLTGLCDSRQRDHVVSCCFRHQRGRLRWQFFFSFLTTIRDVQKTRASIFLSLQMLHIQVLYEYFYSYNLRSQSVEMRILLSSEAPTVWKGNTFYRTRRNIHARCKSSQFFPSIFRRLLISWTNCKYLPRGSTEWIWIYVPYLEAGWALPRIKIGIIFHVWKIYFV